MNVKKPVVLRRSEDVPIIDISGDVSDAIEADLQATYDLACQSQPKNLIIQFDSDGHIYSSGLAVLTGLVGQAEEKGQQIHAVGLSEHFAEVFDFTGLAKYVRIFPSEQDALASLK